MDDPKFELGDDEFKFTEAEEVSDSDFSSMDESADKPKQSKINRRNIIIAICVIVVALSLYKLIGVFFGAGDSDTSQSVTSSLPVTAQSKAADSEKIEQDQNQASTSQVAAAPKVVTNKKPGVVKVSEGTQPAVQIQPQLSSEELKQRFDDLKKNDDLNAEQAQKITAQLSDLNSSIQTLNRAITSMNQRIIELADDLEQQEKVIKSLRSRPKARKSSVALKKIVIKQKVKRFRWYVQAIIPGRAWLVQKDGKTTTVRVGDRLPGFGRVTAISVLKGTVRLSTGAIIKYENI